jgi:uncharacterized protein YaeQ
MALKSEIYKVLLQVADIDRNYYQDHPLTIARHSSENDKRLMVRILAFALNAHERLAFANGLTNPDEPELWIRDYSGDIDLWIDAGHPEPKMILKACGRSKSVILYTYQRESSIWWESASETLKRAKNLQVFHIDAGSVNELAALADRSMELQVMIQEGDVWVRNDRHEIQVKISRLYPSINP